MFLALLAALSTALVVPSHAQTCGREVLSYNFDEHVGAYTNWTIPKIEAAFPKQVSRPDFRGSMQQPGLVYTEGSERASVGEQQLRVFMPQGCVGTRECGMVFTVRLQDEVDEATLSYRFKFGQGYEWTWGGKLPGLADEDMASGCRSSDVTGTGSFVSRTMWRAGGQLVTYMYITPLECECVNGEDWPYTMAAVADTWYTMFMYLKLNTPGERDGLHKVWIQEDGADAVPQLVYSRNEVFYRSIPGHGIAKLKWDNFHGGSDERYMPSSDQYVFFDDIKVTEGLCVEASSLPVASVSPPTHATATGLKAQLPIGTDRVVPPRGVEMAGPGADAFFSRADDPTVCPANNSAGGILESASGGGGTPPVAVIPTTLSSSASASGYMLLACVMIAMACVMFAMTLL